jgi:hypothetical protein
MQFHKRIANFSRKVNNSSGAAAKHLIRAMSLEAACGTCPKNWKNEKRFSPTHGADTPAPATGWGRGIAIRLLRLTSGQSTGIWRIPGLVELQS